MPNDSKQLSYLKRNAARSKDIFLLDPNHVLAAAHDLSRLLQFLFQVVRTLCAHPTHVLIASEMLGK